MAKAAATTDIILIGCRLPSGIVLEHPSKPEITVTLKGRFTQIDKHFIDGKYSSNEVPAQFWAEWMIANNEFSALKSGAIFVINSVSEAKDISAELTGFEPMSTNGKDPRAKGVVKDDGQ